ncbi:MFS transporter [Methanobacterium subterraneum]|uniref:MFS transporter n=1 Tax=Methanobacterium subterraneum TaxID=59277 RepID=A0A2H4V9Y4_9EURY|nr:MFS transporter [Methanobacterium subterraneum]AUB54888.1 MFS transporter [Methanobacterium subterraneum]AUB61264.1 MFS transporter [Methanobacterium subterraneum]NMO09723.1 MFS transporter [Methanobacterium subterraneum]
MTPNVSTPIVSNDIKIAALLAATIASFFTPFMGSSVNIALPSIGLDFGADAIILNWVTNGFLLAAAIFAVPFGRVADIHGMKKIFTYGIILFTVASLLCALSPTAYTLIGSRILQGIGSAMIFVTGLAIISSVYPPHHRGKAIGINVAAVYVGLSFGPVLGGLMTQYLGWRSLFLLMIPFGLLVTAIVFWKLNDEWAASRGEKFDYVGSILYSLMLFLVMYGFSSLPQIDGWAMLILGIVGFVAFIRWELKAKSPVFNVRLFKNTAFTFSSLAALINYSATFAVTLLLSYYLQFIKGLEPQAAGLILVAQPIIMAITAPIAGRMSDRFDARLIATTGMATVTLALFTLTFIDGNTPLNDIIIGLGVLGLGFGLFSSPNTNVIMGSVERRFYGVASATVSTMRLIGQTMSIGIATLVFSLFIGRVQLTPDQYPALLESIQLCFVVFTALCFIGVFVSWWRGEKKDVENGG